VARKFFRQEPVKTFRRHAELQEDLAENPDTRDSWRFCPADSNRPIANSRDLFARALRHCSGDLASRWSIQMATRSASSTNVRTFPASISFEKHPFEHFLQLV